ncbi:hypothetical protein BGC31_05185 [Komagataeibacter xylinus]|nr:hypothetical protein H845_1539 [Komagataeibacter xylinus E25]RFP03275.1 hypothetical protein BGC31_05185 [Komagataeibacter xylinus]
MSATVMTLRPAQAPDRQRMLDMLDGIGAEVEAGGIISLLALAIHPDRAFSNCSAGEMSVTETVGMLERHKLSLLLKLS